MRHSITILLLLLLSFSCTDPDGAGAGARGVAKEQGDQPAPSTPDNATLATQRAAEDLIGGHPAPTAGNTIRNTDLLKLGFPYERLKTERCDLGTVYDLPGIDLPGVFTLRGPGFEGQNDLDLGRGETARAVAAWTDAAGLRQYLIVHEERARGQRLTLHVMDPWILEITSSHTLYACAGADGERVENWGYFTEQGVYHLSVREDQLIANSTTQYQTIEQVAEISLNQWSSNDYRWTTIRSTTDDFRRIGLRDESELAAPGKTAG